MGIDFLNIFSHFRIELALSAGILIFLVLDLFFKERGKLGSWCISLVSFLFVLQIFNWGNEGVFFSGSFLQDKLSHLFKIFFLLTTFFILIMSQNYIERLERGQAEFYLLILLAALGMIFMASAGNFILLFVSLELITVSFYIMTAYLRTDPKSTEAGLKYLILGALSSGFLLYGISFIYGITGSTNFASITEYLLREGFSSKGVLFGFLLILSGIGFKIASVPFQFWVPDVYEGAPTPVTAFLSVGSKTAGFLFFLRVLHLFPHFEHEKALLLSVLSAMTLIYGNLGALPQKNIKRLLGYSSIGHAGYLLMGLASGSPLGTTGVIYYLFSYLFTNLGAFLVVTLVSKNSDTDEISHFSGLSVRSPLLAAGMLIALMSLAGVPPLSGFFGKFLLISSVVQKGMIWLAIIGALSVVVSLYYYLMIVKQMYLDKPIADHTIPINPLTKAAIYLSIFGIIFLGVFQAPLMRLIATTINQ